MITTIDGKKSREVFRLERSHGLEFICLSPDGRFTAFTALSGNDCAHVWVASIAEGRPSKIASLPAELVNSSVWFPRWSPDGKLITFGVMDDNVQYWVMENLLPAPEVAVK